jgi:acyl-CoA thioester hydrolase
MKFDPIQYPYSTEIQVRSPDIDAQFHVNNGIYYQYLEHARVMFLHEYVHWNVFEDWMVIAHASIDYRRPIRFDDKPRIYMAVTEVGNKSFTIKSIIAGRSASGDEVVFAEATTVQVTVDKEGRPVPIPEKYLAKLNMKS